MSKQKTTQFREDVKNGLARILKDSEEITKTIEKHYSNIKNPFSGALNHKTGEYIFYISPNQKDYKHFIKIMKAFYMKFLYSEESKLFK